VRGPTGVFISILQPRTPFNDDILEER
jgi:hypothetical protein